MLAALLISVPSGVFGKTIAINIGFDFDSPGAPPEGNLDHLLGVPKDMIQFQKIQKSANISDVINITEKDFREYPNKKEFLNFLKKRISPGDRVLFNYSGHGVAAPRHSGVVLKSPKEIASENSEFVFLDRRFAECVSNRPNPFLEEPVKSSYKACYAEGVTSFDGQTQLCKAKPRNSEACVNAFVENLKVTDKCRISASGEVGLGFPSKDYLYSRFYKNVNGCFEDFALLSSDLEDLFKDNEVLMHVDACMSGVLSGFKGKKIVIGASSGTLELSSDSRDGGIYTLSKARDLSSNPCAFDKNKDGRVSLTEWYQHSPDSFLMSREKENFSPDGNKTKNIKEATRERFMNSIMVSKDVIEEETEPVVVPSYDPKKCKTMAQVEKEVKKTKSKEPVSTPSKERVK
ncbi:hypothetical protein [Roseateles albus]|uniref:Uncharacterized protein n=1 Tax=Roseateles albus TaxID=2987525 RepID=A0ABT5KKW9_9BURK|nr:hypothetical protein [Roseateles albus]MDC8774582.1 hypothetical protein [Roseateles albus]